MATWDSYTQKATPEDNDTLMIKDTAGAANKRTPFSGVWNWIVNKLTSAVISNLQTNSKSIIPAINELNSKIIKVNTGAETEIRYPIYSGLRFLGVSTAMGSNGINGPDPTIFVIEVNYDATACKLTPIYKSDNVMLTAEISGGEVILTETHNSGAVGYIRALFFPIS